MKSHIFYKGSSELRGGNTKYFFLIHMSAKNFKIWYKIVKVFF